ncbi:MAG: hypothetical protein BHW57_00585 [Azospirillum sp. 47_25]|jgi:hypothetical protein|nr:MAG: hypothetical protein BHW57_00585 [Azospirillum sp. 47_25]
MKSALKTLTRIQKFQIDEQRKILSELQEKQDILQAQLEQLNRDFEQEKEFARNNAGVGDFGAYVKRYMQQRENLEMQVAVLEKKIEHERDVMADMFKEQKTYEIVDDQRTKRAAKEEEQKMQKVLDEIGTNSFLKNHKK